MTSSGHSAGPPRRAGPPGVTFLCPEGVLAGLRQGVLRRSGRHGRRCAGNRGRGSARGRRDGHRSPGPVSVAASRPGFARLAPAPPATAVPRIAAPRARVPAVRNIRSATRRSGLRYRSSGGAARARGTHDQRRGRLGEDLDSPAPFRCSGVFFLDGRGPPVYGDQLPCLKGSGRLPRRSTWVTVPCSED